MKKQIIILSLLVSALGYAQEDKKTKTIEEITIKKTKKAVEQKTDRTIFDFSEQTHINTGTAMEGIKKLPGLMNSDLTGMVYQGKNLAVYMDGRPLNITSTELTGFLEGLPASAIERIEIITNPGAEFPATGGGAIMNIITSKSAKNYLTATYSGNYSFSHYDKFRNKTNQSILLNSKNKWFGWQLNTGINYNEGFSQSTIDLNNNTFSDDIGRSYFTRTAFSFDLGKDRLLLNYNFNHNNNDNNVLSSGNTQNLPYQRQDFTNSKRLRHEAVATYQKRFDDPSKKLDFKLSHIHFHKDFEQDNQFYHFNSAVMRQPLYTNTSHSRETEFKINYSQDIALLDKGKIHIGGLYEWFDLNTHSQSIKNLDYQRQTISTFAELQTSKGKWDFTLGVRGEDYDISGVSLNTVSQRYEDLTKFKQYKLFPNASVQYNFSPMVNLSASYNKKIALPSINMLNPNTSNYSNDNFIIVGNAHLQPTIYDYFRVKISAFNYLFVSYDLGLMDNIVADRTVRNGNQATVIKENLASITTHNVAMGVPLPLALIKHSLKEVMAIHPDKMNLIYLVAAYLKQVIPNFDSNGLWYLNANGNFALPKDIKLNFNYTIIPSGGGHFYQHLSQPFNHTLNLTLSKKFLKNQLNVSLFANDVFNTNKFDGYSKAASPYILLSMKSNSQSFGISVNYKIPTHNKLAKENPSMLLENQEEEQGGGIMK